MTPVIACEIGRFRTPDQTDLDLLLEHDGSPSSRATSETLHTEGPLMMSRETIHGGIYRTYVHNPPHLFRPGKI